MKRDFVLFYLCTDDETYNTILKLSIKEGNKNLQAVHLDHILTPDNLYAMRNLPQSNYGDKYSQFCWALTPYFTNWLLLNQLPKNAELLYCDADIFFYHNPELIFTECRNHSVGIHKHRFRGEYNVDTNDVGEFNVGCVFFKNNTEGKIVSTWWKNCLLDPDNQYHKKYGTCGDQKYLDLFIPMFAPAVHIFDHEQSGIGHGAPWNFNCYEFIADRGIIWNNHSQLLVFNHFSHFKIVDDVWYSSDHGEWKPEEGNQIVTRYYERYYEELVKASKIISEL